MLAVVEEHGDGFDAVNVATAMHRVAKLQPPNADMVTQAPLFNRLTGEIPRTHVRVFIGGPCRFR